MKKLSFLLVVCFLFLTSCYHSHIPESVVINDVKYIKNFYGDLFPISENIYDENLIFILNDREYCHISHEKFDMYYNTIMAGTVYCSELQWEEAKAYYADNSNFRFYCFIGNIYDDDGERQIKNIDTDKFNELMVFLNENSYDPFNRNDKINTVVLPMPDEKSPEIHFYKRSNDELFTSYQGNTFHIIGDKLYLLYYYDFDYGNDEKMLAVEVTKELSDYFVDIVKQFL